MALVITAVGIVVFLGIGAVASWVAWGDPECADEGRHPLAGCPGLLPPPAGTLGPSPLPLGTRPDRRWFHDGPLRNGDPLRKRAQWTIVSS